MRLKTCVALNSNDIALVRHEWREDTLHLLARLSSMSLSVIDSLHHYTEAHAAFVCLSIHYYTLSV